MGDLVPLSRAPQQPDQDTLCNCRYPTKGTSRPKPSWLTAMATAPPKAKAAVLANTQLPAWETCHRGHGAPQQNGQNANMGFR